MKIVLELGKKLNQMLYFVSGFRPFPLAVWCRVRPMCSSLSYLGTVHIYNFENWELILGGGGRAVGFFIHCCFVASGCERVLWNVENPLAIQGEVSYHVAMSTLFSLVTPRLLSLQRFQN